MGLASKASKEKEGGGMGLDLRELLGHASCLVKTI
jgi:hypothetical protein